MLRIVITLITIVCLYPASGQAKLTIDVSEPRLEITTGFSGDILTVFGTADPKSDVVILVRGPKSETTVLRQDDIYGLWIKSDSITFQDVPGYYNIASSRPVTSITNQTTLNMLRLGLDSLTFEAENSTSNREKFSFQEALIQDRQLRRLYSLTPNAVVFLTDTLFKTRIPMPANVPLGQYTIEAFAFQNGLLIDQVSQPFNVNQTGVTAEIHDYSRSNPFFYGLLIIITALTAGFLASILLRRD